MKESYMAKKPNIDLTSKNITYEQNNQIIKLLLFKTSNMTLEVAIYEKEQYVKKSILPFAHLPKNIKSLIKPL